jgi:5'-nucleotidase
MKKILITNDDGIDAPGLDALARAAQGLGEVIVVAPQRCHSGCSHQVTTGGPIRVEERRPGWYAIAGTPADCVRLGLYELAGGAEIVLSGINAGGNLGSDVHHSGTVAAAREAALHGVASLALSQYRRRDLPFDWDRSAELTGALLREILHDRWEAGTLWNINLPHLEPGSPRPETIFCALDPSPLPLNYRRENGDWIYEGDYHRRQRKPGADVDVCFGGKIAVTCLRAW